VVDLRQRGLGAMLARERLMPAPGFAWCRSAYFGGAIRLSTRRGLVDWIKVVSRRIVAFALRGRRLASRDIPFDCRFERLIAHLRPVSITWWVS
jgi:hypothetical protein